MNYSVPSGDHGEVTRLDSISRQVSSLSEREAAGRRKKRPKPQNRPAAAAPAQGDAGQEVQPKDASGGGSVDVLA